MSKSVSTTLDDKDYDALKTLADEQDRNISGQLRHLLRAALSADRAIAEEVARIAAVPTTAHDVHSGLTPGAKEPNPEGWPPPSPEEGPTEADLASGPTAKGVPVREPLPG